jgi:hypothetical protein
MRIGNQEHPSDQENTTEVVSNTKIEFVIFSCISRILDLRLELSHTSLNFVQLVQLNRM